MTLVQSKKHQRLFILLIALAGIALLAEVAALIFLYNRTVNLRHAASGAALTFEKTEAANAELKDEIFKATDGNRLETLAKNLNLVKDQAPRYVEISNIIGPSWAIASER